MEKKQENVKPLTLDDLRKFTDDVLLPKIKKSNREEFVKYTDDVLLPKIRKSTRMDFMEFTDDVLLPAIEDIVDEKLDKRLGEHTHEMKNYIDSKLTEHKGDIIAYVNDGKKKDKTWKIKNISILKKSTFATQQELKILSDLA